MAWKVTWSWLRCEMLWQNKLNDTRFYIQYLILSKRRNGRHYIRSYSYVGWFLRYRSILKICPFFSLDLFILFSRFGKIWEVLFDFLKIPLLLRRKLMCRIRYNFWHRWSRSQTLGEIVSSSSHYPISVSCSMIPLSR